MVSGRADPERDGVADYARHLSTALRDLGEEVVPVPVLGPREAAERLRALKPDLAHVQFAPSAFRFSARPGLLPDMVRGLPLVATLHEYGWWSAPALGAGPGVAAGGTPGLVRPRDLAARPRPARAVATTNAGHARTLADRFGIEATSIPLAPNVPDLGAARAGRDAPPARRAGRRPSDRVLRVRAPGQGCALPDRGVWPRCAPPAGRGCTCSCSAASPRSRCPPRRPPRSAPSWTAGPQLRRRRPRHHHRAPAGRRRLRRAARRRPGRVPVHRGGVDQERRAARPSRTGCPPGDRRGPARSGARGRPDGRGRAPGPGRRRAGRRPRPAAGRPAAAA